MVSVGGTTCSCSSVLFVSGNHSPTPSAQHPATGLRCKLAPPIHACTYPYRNSSDITPQIACRLYGRHFGDGSLRSIAGDGSEQCGSRAEDSACIASNFPPFHLDKRSTKRRNRCDDRPEFLLVCAPAHPSHHLQAHSRPSRSSLSSKAGQMALQHSQRKPNR